jgi:hypothetical protein
MSKSQNLEPRNVLEAAGVVAVLVGLIFVGIELRQNTAAVRATTSQSLAEQSNHLNSQLAMNAEFAALYLRASENLDDLTVVNRLRYLSYITSEFNIWEQAFYNHVDGTLNDGLWHAYDDGYHGFLCEGSPAVIWEEIKDFFGAEFRAHVCAIGTN